MRWWFWGGFGWFQGGGRAGVGVGERGVDVDVLLLVSRDGVDDGMFFSSPIAARVAAELWSWLVFSSFSSLFLFGTKYPSHLAAKWMFRAGFHGWVSRLVGGPHSQICDAANRGNPGAGVPALAGRQTVQDASDWRAWQTRDAGAGQRGHCQCFCRSQAA